MGRTTGSFLTELVIALSAWAGTQAVGVGTASQAGTWWAQPAVRGGGPADPEWSPPSLALVHRFARSQGGRLCALARSVIELCDCSRAIRELAARARASPTGEDVFEVAKRIHPHDKALALGVQNVSIYGHAHTLRRLQEFQHYCEHIAPDETRRLGERMLRYRSRLKRWGGEGLYSDALIEEMMQHNQSFCDDCKETRPPNGWPLHRPAEEAAILQGIDDELRADPGNATWLAAKAVLRLWTGGLRPLYDEWDVRDEYAPVEAAVDEAEQLFIAALDAGGPHPDVLCQYGKLLEAFRGDYDAAEHRYSQALAADPNHIPTLTFYSYFLRDLRNDSSRHRAIQGRKDLLMDPTRLHKRNSDVYYDPAVVDGDLRPLYAAIARGTSEVGPTAVTPWDYLPVPGLSAEELRRLGYSRKEAEALRGGPEHMRTGAETWGFWQWHGFYQQFWKHRGREYQGGGADALGRAAAARVRPEMPPGAVDARVAAWKAWEDGPAGGFYLDEEGAPRPWPQDPDKAKACVCHCVLCRPKKAPPKAPAPRRQRHGGDGAGGEGENEETPDNSTAAIVWQRVKAAILAPRERYTREPGAGGQVGDRRGQVGDQGAWAPLPRHPLTGNGTRLRGGGAEGLLICRGGMRVCSAGGMGARVRDKRGLKLRGGGVDYGKFDALEVSSEERSCDALARAQASYSVFSVRGRLSPCLLMSFCWTLLSSW